MFQVDFQVGAFVLGFDAASAEWKTAEITELTDKGYKVHFEDDNDNKIVELGLDEVQPLEPERFQVRGWVFSNLAVAADHSAPATVPAGG